MHIKRPHPIILGLAAGVLTFCLGGQSNLAAQEEGARGLKPEEAGIRVNPKRKKKSRQITFSTQNSFARRPAPAGTRYVQVGVTIWLIDSGKSKGVEQVGTEQTQERLDTNAAYAEGDTIRLSIVSPDGGFLYVVDQEQYSDGSYSPAVLAFPTLTTRKGNNLIQAWERVNVPAYPSVWRFKPWELQEGEVRKKQVAEVLTVIISPRPLVDRSRISDQQLVLNKGEFERWQARWKTPVRQFDVENSVGQILNSKSVEQVGAEADDDEFGAQTVYQVAAKPGNPLWVSVPLRFKASVASQRREPAEREMPHRRVRRSISGAEAHSYSGRFKAGQFLHATVAQHGVDVVVRVYGPEGGLLEERDRTNGRYGEESLSVEVPTTGVHRVEVKPLGDDAREGRYEVVVEQPRAATERDKRRISAEKVFQEAEKLRLAKTRESWKSAVPKYREAAAVWHEIGDNYAEGVALSTVSDIHRGLGQADEAMETEAKALAIFRALKDRNAEGSSLMHLAYLLGARGKHEEALKHYKQAAEAMRAGRDAEGESAVSRQAAGLLASLGDSQNGGGNSVKAAESYRRAITLYQSAGDKRGVADLLDRLDRLSLGEQPGLVTQTGHTDAVTSVVYAPRAAVVASLDWRNIILWSTSTGHKLRSFTCNVRDGAPTIVLRYNPLAVGVPWHPCQLAFSPDGKFLTSVSISNSLSQRSLYEKKWDVLTGELKSVSSYAINPDEKGDIPYESVALSADGMWAAAANSENGSITVIDFEKLERQLIKHEDGRVHAIKFSPDSRTVAALTDKRTVTLWDLSSGRKTQSFEDCKGVFAISNQQKLLACASPDNAINLWDIATGKKLPGPAGHAGRVVSLTFSPDGRRLVSGSDDKSLRIWDLTDGSLVIGSSSDGLLTDAVAFSPDGTLLAGGSADKTVRLLSVATGEEVRRFSGGVSDVTDVAVSRRKNLLAVCFGNSVELWDLSSVKRVQTLTADNPLSAVAFSGDGNVVAAGGRGDKVTLWDLETGLSRTIGNFDHYVREIIFSPEGDKIAVASQMSMGIRIADLKSGSVTTSVEADTVTLLTGGSTARSAKGKLPEWADFDKFEQKSSIINEGGTLTLVSHSSEQVKFLDPSTGKERASFSGAGSNDWLVTTPDGFFDGTVGAWKKAIWLFNNNTFDYGAIEIYFNDFFRPGLLQDVLAGKVLRPKPGRELERQDRRRPTVKIASIDGKSKEEINAQPTYHLSTGMSAVTVAVEVADGTGEKKQALHDPTSGARDLRLFRNGSLVKVWHGDVFNLMGVGGCEQPKPTAPNQPRRIRCQTVVPILVGDNTFTAYAFNSSNVKSNDDVFSFKSSGGSNRPGTFYVLAVGINDYLRAGKLRYAVDDATELAAALQREQGKLGVYDSTQVITLTDAEATKKNILLALTRFRSDASDELPPNALTQFRRIKPLTPEDALVIVLSGHGVADAESFYLLPRDANPARLREGAVSDSELNDVLEHVDAGQLLLIIDACQSGKALGQARDGRGPLNSKGLAQLAYDKGMSILAAAQSYQAALEVSRTLTGKDIKHGLLTFALLDGLTSKKAADAGGTVLERTWFDYAVGEVPRMQIEEMKKRRGKGLTALFVEDDGVENRLRRYAQVPRVFYRREENMHPLVIAKP